MENDTNTNDNFWKEAEKRHKRGKIAGGFFLVVVGSLFLGRELGAEIPHWIFSWKTLLIALGLVVGIKSAFADFKWIPLVLVGLAFLIGDLYPELAIKHLLWPILIIAFGIMIIFKPRRKHHAPWSRWERRHRHKWEQKYKNQNWDCAEAEAVNQDKIDFTTFMGGVKKNILSKNFKGGEIHNVFGGSEINLSQADFQGTVVLEVTNVFGGTKLVVPPNWEIQSELTSVMGSIEDKRPILQNGPDPNKVLVLKGTVFMGGIDITSY